MTQVLQFCTSSLALSVTRKVFLRSQGYRNACRGTPPLLERTGYGRERQYRRRHLELDGRVEAVGGGVKVARLLKHLAHVEPARILMSESF